MYNLYQSQLRKDIQHEIYRKPMFTVELFSKKYFGTIKIKKFGPFTTRRYQIMGVQLPDDEKYVQKELANLRKKFRNKGIFLQLGIINEIVSFENITNKCEEFRQDMRDFRIGLQKILYSNFSLKIAFRENMPTAGIIYDVTKSDEELLKDMNESCRKRTKKAIAGGMQYRIIDKNNHEEFFAKRQETADAKGFNTISKSQYEGLLKYIQQGKGMLIGAFLDGEMIAGTICLFDDKLIYCPYGFFDRKYSNIGVQHFLKFKLFSRARDNGFHLVDTGGGAPTGFPKHPLASVSAFKESLGGTKSEQYGSYDMVFNKFLYRAFKLWYRLRG
ncbi:MAG: GNAT family N-acetyltransferase [Candidatus Absconditabacterales bacterium]